MKQLTKKTDDMVLTRQAIGKAPLVAAHGLINDLMSIHALNLNALIKAIQRPGVLLDEDNIPHQIILARISKIQEDIITASHTLIKLDKAINTPKHKKSNHKDVSAPTGGADHIDVSTIILELERERQVA